MTEQQTASPELQLFFDNLLEVKRYCKNIMTMYKNDSGTVSSYILFTEMENIYNRLDDIIKDERTEVTHA